MLISGAVNFVRWIVAAVLLGALFMGGSLALAIQPADVYPARIQAGTCDAPGDTAFELTAVGASLTHAGTPVAVEAVGSSAAVSIQLSVTTLETSLSKLTADDYAIVVYAGNASEDIVLACGDLGGPLTMQMTGMVMPGDELAVGLAELEESGFSGLALIRAEGAQATVRVFLMESAGDD